MIIKSFDGIRISYKVKRKGSLFLVFIHGWAADWTTWKKEIAFFQKKGYSTLTLDLRGHGQSDKPEEKDKYLLECFAKDNHTVLEKEKIKRVVLIGHSMGGAISLMYYHLFQNYKNIESFILCGTTYRNVFQHKKIKILLPFVKQVLDFILKNEHINKRHFNHLKDIDLSKYRDSSDYSIFYHGLHNTPLKSVFACLESMLNFDLKKILPKIKSPVLIIEGEKDKILPQADSIEMHKLIRDAEIVVIPEGKHGVNIQNPELVSQKILGFLSKHALKPR